VSWQKYVEPYLSKYAPDLPRHLWDPDWRIGDVLAQEAPARPFTFVAVDAARDPAALDGVFRRGWPAWRAWYLRDGAAARPSLAASRAALVRHMPELVEAWQALADRLAPGDELAARFLSGWNPPALVSGCSGAAPAGSPGTLVRSYDYDPNLFDGVVLLTHLRRRVLGTADQLWGLLDGVNDAGLAVSFTFGGRPDSGEGFAVPMVVRYLLETCDDVGGAVAALRRLPIHVAYNVSLVDASGAAVVVHVAPGRPAEVVPARATTNHQGRVTWPEHAAWTRSAERLATLGTLLADPGADVDAVVAAMLREPLRATRWDEGFGTLYVAAIDARERTLTQHWPSQSWRHELDDFAPGTRVVDLAAAAPAGHVRAAAA
jgi:predicted choloylglycine hydrolase